MEAKAAAMGREASTQVAEIEEYLKRGGESWDLIVFSSVLHHLEDPRAVVRPSIGTRGGVLLTMFDPTQAGTLGRQVRRADWIIYALAHDRPALTGAFRTHIRGWREHRSGPHIGQLAERHALTGVPDEAIVDDLRREGFEIVRHSRTHDARSSLVEYAFRGLRRPSDFSLIARRADNDRASTA